MAQGGSPSARPTGPFGQGIQQMQPVQPVQLKGDPAAGMTPISMPSNYPSWQPQHPMNGMHGGQLAMHGSPMGNGGPISTGAPGVGTPFINFCSPQQLCSPFMLGLLHRLRLHRAMLLGTSCEYYVSIS